MKKRIMTFFIILILFSSFCLGLEEGSEGEEGVQEDPETNQNLNEINQIPGVSSASGSDVSKSGSIFFFNILSFSFNGVSMNLQQGQIKETEEGLKVNAQTASEGENEHTNVVGLEVKDDKTTIESTGQTTTRTGEGTTTIQGAVGVELTENQITAASVQGLRKELPNQVIEAKNAKSINDNNQEFNAGSAEVIKYETLKQGYQFTNVQGLQLNKETYEIKLKQGDLITRDDLLHINGGENLHITEHIISAEKATSIKNQESNAYSVENYLYTIKNKDLEFNKVENLILNTIHGITNINKIKGKLSLIQNMVKNATITSLADNNTIAIPTPLSYAPYLHTYLDTNEKMQYSANLSSINVSISHDDIFSLNRNLRFKKIKKKGEFVINNNKTGNIKNVSLHTRNSTINGTAYFKLNNQFMLEDVELLEGKASILDHEFVNTKEDALTIHQGDKTEADVIITEHSIIINGKTQYILKNVSLYESFHKEIESILSFTQDYGIIEELKTEFIRNEENLVITSGSFMIHENKDRYYILEKDKKQQLVHQYHIKNEIPRVYFADNHLLELLLQHQVSLYIYDYSYDINEKIKDIKQYHDKIPK